MGKYKRLLYLKNLFIMTLYVKDETWNVSIKMLNLWVWFIP